MSIAAKLWLLVGGAIVALAMIQPLPEPVWLAFALTI